MFKTEDSATDKEKEKNIPDSWCGHVFTYEERCNLMTGNEVFADDFISKKTRKTFSASLA